MGAVRNRHKSPFVDLISIYLRTDWHYIVGKWRQHMVCAKRWSWRTQLRYYRIGVQRVADNLRPCRLVPRAYLAHMQVTTDSAKRLPHRICSVYARVSSNADLVCSVLLHKAYCICRCPAFSINCNLRLGYFHNSTIISITYVDTCDS